MEVTKGEQDQMTRDLLEMKRARRKLNANLLQLTYKAEERVKAERRLDLQRRIRGA
jgi:hypothetical protein